MKKIAVVGVGAMGNNHARILHELKTVKLVAICDLNQKIGLTLAKKYKTKYYKNYKELLRNESLDAAVIAVPTNLHKKSSLAFLSKGISVLVEKPIASNVNDAKEIINKAKEKNVILVVGHVERFNPAVIALQELVKSNKLGDILSIVIKRVGLTPPRTKDVNVVTDLAIHDLDIVVGILGKLPKSVFARGGRIPNSKIEDHAEIFLDYQKFGCFIQANWVTPVKIRTLSITGTKGHAELNYISQELEIYKKPEYKEDSTGFKQFIKVFRKPEKKLVNISPGEPLKEELLYFLNLLSANKPIAFTPVDALNALKLSVAVNKSIQKQSVVNL